MNDICCPQFNPDKWDEKVIQWDNKLFIKESIPTLFHIPFPPMIGKKITKMMNLVEKANKLDTDKEAILVLFQDPSAFKSNIFVSVTGNVSGANNTSISGTFVAKVYDGSFSAVPKFIKDMNAYLEKAGYKAPKSDGYYVHYAYCPKCAEKFKHNYMVLFAKQD